jgi:hypothetical protein
MQKVVECDVCGSAEGVCRYRLSKTEVNPRTVTMDLCEEHGAPVEELMQKKPNPHRRSRKVASIAEVKSVAKKSARKK